MAVKMVLAGSGKASALRALLAATGAAWALYGPSEMGESVLRDGAGLYRVVVDGTGEAIEITTKDGAGMALLRGPMASPWRAAALLTGERYPHSGSDDLAAELAGPGGIAAVERERFTPAGGAR